jgi:FKBP-type peptidyl-prolyl cis-trans isomerase FklB
MKRTLTILFATTAAVTLTAAESTALPDQKAKVSYSMGMNLGNTLRRLGVEAGDIDSALVLQGIKDAQGGSKTLLTDQEMMTTLQAFQRESQTRLGQKNKQAGEEFLAKNKSAEGVKSLAVKLPGDKTVEMQYKILAEGSGQTPGTNDTVTVNYRGTLLDGTEFDSSYSRNQPATFALNRVIRGWTEGLQLLKPGGKAMLYIPPDLAYGAQGTGPKIGPNSTLIFEVELISAQAPATPPAPPSVSSQPITSDIIKVPSKEELEKGAKIEVIKAADLEKLKEQEKAKAQGEKK